MGSGVLILDSIDHMAFNKESYIQTTRMDEGVCSRWFYYIQAYLTSTYTYPRNK